MTDDELSEGDFENFEEKTKEEKLDTLQRLHTKLSDGDADGLLQKFDFEGEMTVRVIDDDGNEKQVEKSEFKN